ncbi:SPFH domain-containing protein [Actinospica sp.]|jgi:regulator of protease activity HflC (stomatin/prohibitin superfamily)|uniref:SPFH domain-containing protein n=1 Tax=Actinospica sp. TaxID=1872142 RepID=UPI002BE03E07|nr:SPFH domain-containing protein [Actinospica sp.]HWG22988.1 SPFH domain-containing protein [Actinospica sp.]
MSTPITTTGRVPVVPVSEREQSSLAGIPMLVLGIVLLGGGIALLVLHKTATVAPGLVVLVAAVLVLKGLTPVSPGQARVVALFGRYLGTVRTTGLRWVNPFTTRQRVSTRIRNHETQTLKVNDADGNPIEMAAVVVWQVEDTAKSVYSVEDARDFVTTQAETAVRHIAGHYPYDSRGMDRISLRDSADEVTSQLSTELSQRVMAAGVAIIESRITRLSYATEIAQAMLRRQQADAIVAARERLVEGAVGMVRSALRQIDEEHLVELDEERKASMVSNLLVVLCSDQPVAPVVNTGTLYQ